MKLSSLLNHCKSADCRYNPENVLRFLNDFMDDECSLCHRCHDSLDDAFGSCFVELKLVIQ